MISTLRNSNDRSIFLVDSFYYSVLQSLGLDRRLPSQASYEGSLEHALGFGFGTGASYARALSDLGWEAHISIANSLGLQAAWAQENGLRRPVASGWKYGAHLARLPLAGSALHLFPHLHRILLEQVKAAKPAVVMVQDLNLVPPGLALEIRKHTRLLVGEIASPLPPRPFVASYDLIVSALPSIVEKASSWGIPALSISLGFDAQWQSDQPASARPIDAIFVGSFSRLQPQTAPLLRAVADRVPGLKIYGSASQKTLREAGLTDFYNGPAWGRDMFTLLGRSKVVINRHGSIAGPYAVNMRMFEATGSGAVLVTEGKSNLSDFFAAGQEVLAYETVEEAAELTAAVLADPPRLDRVSAAGRSRTLSQHTYVHRAQQLSAVLAERMSQGRKSDGR